MSSCRRKLQLTKKKTVKHILKRNESPLLKQSIKKNIERRQTERNNNLITRISSNNLKAHFYKISRKQTKNWREINKTLKEHVFHLIDSSVTMVAAKRHLAENDDVQGKLNCLKAKLKASLNCVKVPKEKYLNYVKIKAAVATLKELAEELEKQNEELDQAKREEERAIEQLADTTEEFVELEVEVPKNQLNLPEMTSETDTVDTCLNVT